ncbi:MAG: T9SS type A sorting domain-containing protein [Chitinophagaceae bacterium]|nr:MAG: T9SS type A sorting domain-containing protein [Chitinophagaceae bacterium]
MKLFSLATTCLLLFSMGAKAQETFRSDAELMTLVNKYVTSPVQRTTKPNGDVLLQRDMTAYLKSTVQATLPPQEADHGHDHKSDMLLEFLNRPHPNVATLNRYFSQAAAEFSVPVAVLKAVAQVQSNWAQVSESLYGSWGVMGLIENSYTKQISLASALLQVDAASIKNDARTNIRAAAALLRSYQQSQPGNSIEQWFASVEKLTGLVDPSLRHELALRIYKVISTGAKTVTLWGEIIAIDPANILLGREITDPLPTSGQDPNQTEAVDYPLALENLTTCTSNFGTRPVGAVINFYFVHYVATGTYQGAIDWFKTCTPTPSGVSAHYVVRNSDGQVTQVVREANRAYSQGVALYNNEGIGVEHEVLATNLTMWDSEPMLASATALCADVCDRNGIPKIRRVNNGDRGIYGHSDVRATDCPNLTQDRWDNFIFRVNNLRRYVAPPVLFSIANAGTGTELSASWKTYADPNLAGYRLYYATNDSLNNWALVADETTLTPASTSLTLNAAQFLVPPTGNVYHFKLTAMFTDGANPLLESAASDIYSRSSNSTGSRALIVDGFDRYTGSASYKNITHPFVTSYFKALRDKGYLQISSAANEKVGDGTINLNNYDIVVWFTGDESSADTVFTANEKTAIKSFLEGGGKFILSGSEIAYNVGRAASTVVDMPFMNGYLKSTYVGDGAISYTPATGIAGTAFQGLNLPFGIVYPEDFPDAINAVTGATNIFDYAVANMRGGVAYKGVFGPGTEPGAVIFLSFTLETASPFSIELFTQRALTYFDEPVITTPPTAFADAATAQSGAAKRITVLVNDADNGTLLLANSVEIVSQPTNGTVSVNAAGEITYVSNNGYTGADNFQYRVKNSNNQFSNAATVSITVVAATSCDPAAPETDDSKPKKDLRGAWVSTVSNIDWPSSRTLTSVQQQDQLLRILDTLKSTGFNTVFLQIRPEGDALYASTIEPWSYWLTNSQGTAPSPFWDPLAFAVAECHKRGMQLHAWINPYRAKQSTPTLAPNHVASLHPEWTFISGTATLLNPGLPQVRNYLTEVIADISSRYDIDGIHFDDYFYPYAGMTGQDTATYRLENPTAIATIEDWRRDNINKLIAKVYDTIAFINTASNRNILFGVSPFGIWKSGTPAGISGTSSYSVVYCDPIAWMQAGKVDYVAPQLYWKITGPQDYNILSKWWNDQGVLYNRHVYPGLALYKMTDANNWAASEIENQIAINRASSHEQVKGQIMFSTQQIMANAKGIKTALQGNQYKYKSFAPALPWKDNVCPAPPTNTRQEADTLRWDVPVAAADGDLAKRYVVYRFANIGEAMTNRNDASKIYAIVPANKVAILPADANSYFAVTALDKNNNESEISLGVVLPVTGLELTVQLSGNTSMVNWTTLTEINSRYFEVQRSTDGVHFTTVARVDAAGNSNAARSYQYQDVLLSRGTYYYRIRLTDLDARNSLSHVKHVVYSSDQISVVVGPNPFNNGINVSNLADVAQLDILDVTGRVLASRKLNNESNVRMNLPSAPAGVYSLRITKTDKTVSVLKLVKN